MKKHCALILCSGGIDSVTTAHYVKKMLHYSDITLLFFNYQQRALNSERQSAQYCAQALHASFKEITIPELKSLTNTLLTGSGKPKMTGRKDLKDTSQESKRWYVPCRNLLFLSYALACAESLYVKKRLVSDIFVGFKHEGKEWYSDTTPQFLVALSNLAKISCAHPFKISAPLITKDKEDILLLGTELGVDFQKTWSCYIGRKKHCGRCLACRLRKAGFYWSGIRDPAPYS